MNNPNEINNRINKLRTLMEDRGIDFYIIPTGDPHGSEYIDAYYREREFMSGFTGSAGTLLVSMEQAVLFVDGRYHIQADEQCKGTDIQINKLGLSGVLNCPDYLKKNVKSGQTIGFYGDLLTEREYESISSVFGIDAKNPEANIDACANNNVTNNDATNNNATNNSANVNNVHFYIEEDLVDIIWSEPVNSTSKLDYTSKSEPSEKSNYLRPAKLDSTSKSEPSVKSNSLRPARTANPVYLLPDEIIGTKAADKLENVRKFMKEKNLDGMLISELSDICWLLNIRGSDIEYNPIMLAYLLVMKESCTVFLQDGATETGLHNASDCTVKSDSYSVDADCTDKSDSYSADTDHAVKSDSYSADADCAVKSVSYNTSADCTTEISLHNTLASQIGVQIAPYNEIRLELAKLKNKKIGLDPSSTSCLNYKILNCGNYITEIKNYEAIPKHIKDEKEIELCRKYHELDAVAMIRFIMWVKSAVTKTTNMQQPTAQKNSMNETDAEQTSAEQTGAEQPTNPATSSTPLTEYSAAQYLDNLRAENEGFVSLSFDTISAYAENGAIVHYSPDSKASKTLEPKGLLLVDSGAQYMGTTTDITRTISLGQLSDDEKKAYTLVLKGNLKLMSAVFPEESRGENLDILARQALWNEGLDYLHGTGHGIGAFLNVHEGPCSIRFRINNTNPQPALKPGMILSDEPGYYKAGEFGIRHETQVLVIEKFSTEYGRFYGFEPLSLVPFETESLVIDLMTEEEIEILNKYHELCYSRVEKYLSEDERTWLREATRPIGRR